jgi:hypothetical protein
MQANHLTAWLSDPRVRRFYGPTFELKSDVLGVLVSGVGTLAGVARQHNVTRQAAHKHAVDARKAFNLSVKPSTVV